MPSLKPFSVRWHNFRSLEDSGWIRIRPLTVLIGPNSAGKTSLVAPLLLLKQTLRARDPQVGLVTRGDLVNLGTYWDMVTAHHTGRGIAFNLDFGSRLSARQRRSREVADETATGMRVTFSPARGGRDVLLEKFEIYGASGKRLLARNRLKTGRFSLLGLTSQPGRPRADVDELTRRVRLDAPNHFLFSMNHLAPFALELAAASLEKALGKSTEKRARDDEEIEVTFSEETVLYGNYVSQIEREVRGVLAAVTYLGPLREEPRRVYELSGETPPGIGVHGEFAPEILFRRGRGGGIASRVRKWLRAFGFGDSFHFEDLRGGGAFSLVLDSKKGAPVNIADTGFGVSQVFPLIVQAAVADPGLFITEQPEIHLNPRLQSLLGDLFAEFVSIGHSVIVETHSEHLILRLRRLIAQGKLRPADLDLYFVERVGDLSSVRRIAVGRDGHIDPNEWPVGFFEESLREALALVEAQAKSTAKRFAR